MDSIFFYSVLDMGEPDRMNNREKKLISIMNFMGLVSRVCARNHERDFGNSEFYLPYYVCAFRSEEKERKASTGSNIEERIIIILKRRYLPDSRA